MTDKELIGQENKESHFLILIPFVTLLISVYHYISNFVWAGTGESFSLGKLVWPVCVVLGVIVFLNGLQGKYRFTYFFAVYTFYYVIGAVSSTTLTQNEIINECVYGALFFSLVILFMNYSSKYGVTKIFYYGMRIAIPVAFVAYETMINTFNVSAARTYNAVFYLLYYLPFIFFEKKSLIRYFEFALVFIAIILSYKRTALIIFVLIVLFIFYRANKEATQKRNSKIRIFILSAIILVCIYFIFAQVVSEYANIDWIDRLNALESGSGRKERWDQFFVDMGQANLFQIIFGHGVEYPYYHNDLMQVIYNSGMIGMILYSGMCIQLLIIYVNMAKSRYRYTTAYGASLIIFFLDSAVGQVIVVHTWTLELMVFWGIVLGDFYRERKLKDVA